MPESLIQRTQGSLDELRTLSSSGRLYAVLDACDTPAVPLLAEGLGLERCISLYRGEAEEMYWDIAPYLVHVSSDELLQWIVDFAATDGWGILVVSDARLDAVRRHLRQFLKVLDPDRKQLYFRFYDPHVLEVFLPTCSAEQVGSFFGPVARFGVIDSEKSVAFLTPSRRGDVRDTSSVHH